jgi:hypothetical protein
MNNGNRIDAMAQWMWDARARRLPYRNLPDNLKPATLREAYAAQEAYYRLGGAGLWRGAKIATTTTTKRIGHAKSCRTQKRKRSPAVGSTLLRCR